MIPSIYLNLEDDVARIVQRLKRQRSDKAVLVCPKRCFLFSDSINLRLLKKQADLMGMEVYILTMDEKGQLYAKEAGFQLKFLPKAGNSGSFSDIHPGKPKPAAAAEKQPEAKKKASHSRLSSTVNEIKGLTNLFKGKAVAVKKHPESDRQALVEPKSAVPTPPKISMTESFFPREISQSQKPKKKRFMGHRIFTAAVALFLVLILVLVFVVLPEATVTVYPKTEPITRDMEISLSSNIQQPDSTRLVLPAVKVSETLEAKNKFQSQGKKEVGNKAKGTVQIFNFTRQPLNLKAGTTVLTAGTKSYLLAADISGLRPTGYKNPTTKEVDENTLAEPVEVVAAQGGESFNIPAGTRLEITNQVFGSKPQFLYAKSATSITGGTSRYLSFVSDQDMASSQKLLGEAIVKSQQDSLSARDMVLSEKSYVVEPVQFTADKPVGTESPTFEATLRAKVTGLAFKKSDLQKLIADRIGQTLASNKNMILGDSDNITHKIKNIDLNNEIAVLSVHFEGQAVLNVNLDNIAQDMVGKSQSQVNELLRSRAEVDKIEITLAPVWQKNFPMFANKISVSIGQSQDVQAQE